MPSSIGPNAAPNLAKLVPDVDFERQLEHAFTYPLHLTLSGRRGISPEEVAAREAYYSKQRELPDTHPINIGQHNQEDYEAITFEPSKFALLLAQAMRRLELAKGNADPGVVITPKLQKSANHEAAHGRMSRLLGVACVYSVRAIHDPASNIWVVGPTHSLVGPAIITKLESAAISVAPEDISEGDLLSARAAGYTSREEVLQRLYATHPLLAPQPQA